MIMHTECPQCRTVVQSRLIIEKTKCNIHYAPRFKYSMHCSSKGSEWVRTVVIAVPKLPFYCSACLARQDIRRADNIVLYPDSL